MQRKSSILGPNIVDFGTHFDISSFPGPNMQHTLMLRPANDRLFTQKWSPKWTPKSLNLGVYFHYFFGYSSGPLFQRFCLPNAPKMVPKKLSFLRPPTLLKCRKKQPDLTFPAPGEGPFLRSLFDTPPEHAFIDFLQLWGSIWRHFGDTFSTLFSTSFSDPF